MLELNGWKAALVAAALFLAVVSGPSVSQAQSLAPPSDDTPRITDRVSTPPRSSRKRSTESEDRPGLQARYFGTIYELDCSPGARPGDLAILNAGSNDVPDGTRVLWQISETGERGMFELIGALEAGETLLADSIVSQGPNPTHTCSARAI